MNVQLAPPSVERERFTIGGLLRVVETCPCCQARYRLPAASMAMSSCGPQNEKPHFENGQSGPCTPVATLVNVVCNVPAVVFDTR